MTRQPPADQTKIRQALAGFGRLVKPAEAIEPILPKAIRAALLAWLQEIWAEDDLRAVGLAPRRRALFTGGPGLGKTTLAHHLAARLGLDMVIVFSDRIIDRWLGSSAQNVGRVFDLAIKAAPPVLLFFDEFDSLGFKRKSESSQAVAEEQNSWVNTLLARIENHEGYLIAATNRGADLDQAIWRRFDIQMELPVPAEAERKRILARYLEPFEVGDAALEALTHAMASASPALMRAFCENIKRNVVLGPICKWPMLKAAVFDRVLQAVQPHPDLGKPPLWSEGSRERKQAILAFPWPLTRPQVEMELRHGTNND